MLTVDPDLYHLLPSSLEHIVAHIGIEPAIALVSCFGGSSIPIPMGRSVAGLPALERLVKVVGEQATEKLSAVFGSEGMLYIPRCTRVRRIMRNRTIRQEFDQLAKRESGLAAVAMISIRHALSDRQVWRILKQVD